MHKFLSLTRVTLKNTLGMVSDGKSKSNTNLIIYGILFVCLLPTAGLLYTMFHTAFETLNALDQAGSGLAVAFYLASLITFFSSIFLIPSIFYFSKDSSILLSLPISPEAILGSKFVVCLLYEYLFIFFIVLPAYVAYVDVVSCSFGFVVFSLIILLLLPVFPLVLSSIIAMLVMRFVPFFKNRDRFNFFSGIVTVVCAFGLSFTFNSATMSQNPNTLITTLMSGNNSMIELLGYFFPGVPFAGRALVDENILSLLIFIVITIVSVIICLFLGKLFYFKGLIGFSETSSNRKKMTEKEFAKHSLQKNRILTYTIKELKLLVRTPIYAMNCIGTALVFPILLFIMPMITGGDIDLSTLPINFSSMIDTFWPYIMIGGIVLGIFVSNLNLISSTSISREGSNIAFMKYIPMPLHQQLHAKALSGIIISVITDVFMLIALYFLLPTIPLLAFMILLVTSLTGIVLGNYIGLYIDVIHPKLVWEQEAAAVKQNMTSFIAMMGSWAIAALIGVGAFFIPEQFLGIGTIVILLLMILLSVVLYRGLETYARKAFKNYY